ncbi:2OG-Fe(II) oxygenase [Pseudenhygromyxa sp. WMMC2535]|uniref:2OG-Fe(II) oxygenase n=1 Tax=Pseudenhygromyxa sp. WMMC2535 TaxID=2712867 RepID=UPI001553EA35|nr:2OG-Fe(II) oxygenase [Pseudenhygromyxa sp. WMMC2535]NVB41308.1 2OG-Fe(II) oxygenase [Pseudenhygromyxa sp. WMMC2535]
MSADIEHPLFRVVDDFLDDDAWSELWTDLQFAPLRSVTRTSGAWKLDDGVPLGGDELCLAPKERSGTPIDHVLAGLEARPQLLTGLIDPSWERLSARAYVYPRGTGLSWHVDDHALYAGAFIYYIHPRWDAHWGGELLIAELDDPEDEDEDEGEGELPIMAYRFETEAYSERLMAAGCGSFVMPKPNRLVLLAGAPHMVARVSPAAGQNVRASISGFFLRPRED